MIAVLVHDVERRAAGDEKTELLKRWSAGRWAARRPLGARRLAVIFLAAAGVLLSVTTVHAQTYDPSITTLVKNTSQPVPARVTNLGANITGLYQGFTTGPNADGYELDGISLYVGNSHDSRDLSISAYLYQGEGRLTRVVALHRSGLNDRAHNAWKAPPNTHLKPNWKYYIALDCTRGCEGDNLVEFGVTDSPAEDSGADGGWTIHDRLGFRPAGANTWKRAVSGILRIQVKGRVPHRAYKTEIISNPANGHTYLYGENIDIALTFNAEVYMQERASSIGIRLDAANGPNERTATYLSGSGTTRLVYRYQVDIMDADANGISVDAGGPDSGFSGAVPTLVASLGLLPVDRHYPGLPDDSRHKVDGSLHVTDVEITSTPADGNSYRIGQNIDVTLTFSTEAHIMSNGSVIAIRVGDATDGSNYRAARYASGSGSNRLLYRYRVAVNDSDADGISVDTGGPNSGFGGPLPVTGPNSGAFAASRNYAGLSDDANHKVSRSIAASFDADAFTISEDGTTATVTVKLEPGPDRTTTVPIIAAPGNGATSDDYALSATNLVFAPGETAKGFTVTAVDDSEDDDGQNVEISFGTLPPGVGAGSPASATVTIADNDGAVTGQTVTISAARDAYIAAVDDVVFNLTVAEASEEGLAVNVSLAQEQPHLDAANLTRRVDFPPNATTAELRISASLQSQQMIASGLLTATVIEGAGYQVGTPAAASVRLLVSNPSIIVRLVEPAYNFREGATGPEVSIEVVMETEQGFPAPNRRHHVTVSTEGASATPGNDYATVSRALTFAPGDFSAHDGRWVARQRVALQLIDDDEGELEEIFRVKLTPDASSGDLIQARNFDRTPCSGPCGANIVIIDNDNVGVTFLNGDGNPLSNLRIEVREGEQVTYHLKLERRPAQRLALAQATGPGDPDLVSLGPQSWAFTQDEAAGSREEHVWLEAFPVTVQALQDDDPYSGVRLFHHYLYSGYTGLDYVELPDVVVVEIDSEADGPLRIFGTPEVISRPARGGDTYGPGERIEFRVVFTQPVEVTGSPYLEFQLGSPGAARVGRAGLMRGHGTQDLVFGYTTQDIDNDDDGIEIDDGAIHLDGGRIRGVESGAAAALSFGAIAVQAAHKVQGYVDLSTLVVADARASEQADATLDFVVTLIPGITDTATVDYATSDGTATAGQDYTATLGTLTFSAGERQKIVSVTLLDDAHDEGEETLTLTLSNARGAQIANATATGTIENDDPLQRAWLARFGRTAAQHVLDGVQARLSAPRQLGTQATVAGHDIGSAGETTSAQGSYQTLSQWVGNDEAATVRFEPQLLTTRDVVTQSAFNLGGETDRGFGAVWGRGAHSGFDGAVDGLSLDGGVTTGMLGADYATGRWVVGLSLSHSKGDGTWRHAPSGGEGRITSSLSGLYPYADYDLTERLSLWGVAGYGQGDLTLTLHDGTSYRTDMDLTLTALGLRGDLLPEQQAGHPALAFESDVLLVRMTSDAASGPSGLLAATIADVSRLRLGLEGSQEFNLNGGASITPVLELGLRHDGGDAETGFGIEIGGGLAFVNAAQGLMAEVSARGLVAHEAPGFRDWGVSVSLRYDPTPSSDRGPSVSLAPSWGGSASGGAAALLGRETLSGLAANGAAAAGGRLDAEAAYGLAAFNGRATGTPYLGVGLSEAANEVRVGYRLGLPRQDRLELAIEGTRRQSTLGGTTPEDGVMIRLAVR